MHKALENNLIVCTIANAIISHYPQNEKEFIHCRPYHNHIEGEYLDLKCFTHTCKTIFTHVRNAMVRKNTFFYALKEFPRCCYIHAICPTPFDWLCMKFGRKNIEIITQLPPTQEISETKRKLRISGDVKYEIRVFCRGHLMYTLYNTHVPAYERVTGEFIGRIKLMKHPYDLLEAKLHKIAQQQKLFDHEFRCKKKRKTTNK